MLKRLLLCLFVILSPALVAAQTPCMPPPNPADAFDVNTTIVPGETVLVGGTGPRVVVFHELPGLTNHDLALGARLICEGFQVYMPLMFGTVGQSDNGLGRKQACDERDGAPPFFWCTRSWQEHPILGGWLRRAVAAIGRDGAPMAIVGMCLTGTFALSLANDANVAVAVLAQPTLPYLPWQAAALDVPQETLDRSLRVLAERKGGVFLVRARFDFISAPEKFTRLRLAIEHMRGSGLTDVHVDHLLGLRHSVLTGAAHDPRSSVMAALLAMMRRHLK